MRTITLNYPHKLVFGNDSINNFVEDFLSTGHKNLFLVTATPILPLIRPAIDELRRNHITLVIEDGILAEPTINSFIETFKKAESSMADSVVGIGGGSVLDVAKLIAALLNNTQSIYDILGIGKLNYRKTFLACLPTTSGTGSEVSPNAILLDESDQLKKAAISPYLLSDAVYIDPKLTITVPPRITAATGMDALTHCIEAYANKFSHPIVDLYALEGIRLISKFLKRAVDNGNDLEARENLSLASMYGGLCLGPVNTAAVHALSYPLGGEFHIAHGLSNALLLPYVIQFNLDAAPEKYASIAIAMGASEKETKIKTAAQTVDLLKKLCEDIGIPTRLSELNIGEESVDKIAQMGMTVTRLLKNNVKEITLEDAKEIIRSAL
ncbi:iron-containing alcohol dehydrogenase [Melioribacteraceae bacterium 4301-Me]|uniref:iron-containing alcohol dehydrogenase n=1 Tax=Pyranulibacter aquaticus TaxID=3163344 RepID=UPI0035965220